MSKVILETIGSISKKEILGPLEKDFSNSALVLENIYPFPGYYHSTVPVRAEMNPRNLFLVTKRRYQEESIMRKSGLIGKELGALFNAAIGIVPVYKDQKSVIRIKGISKYEDVANIIDLYRKSGVEFLKYKNIAPYEGIIKIRKYFMLNEIDEGLFEDLEEKGLFYFSVQDHMSWSRFENKTIELKQNMDNNKFDAALGVIYRKNCLIDMVRIYEVNADIDRIKEIRSKYNKA